MDNILRKTITITGVEAKTMANGKPLFKIKDGEGKSYSLFALKADGTESAAYTYYKGMAAQGIGRTVEIGYTEQQGEFQGKAITYKTIIGMKGADQAPVQQQQKIRMINDQGNAEQEKWDRINSEKNDHIKWLNALNNSCMLAAQGKISLNEIKLTAQRIYEMQPSNDDIPTIEYPEVGGHIEEQNLSDEDLSNIPF